jgi:hypothetical protein
LTIDELRSVAAALPVDAFSYAGVNRRDKLLIFDRNEKPFRHFKNPKSTIVTRQSPSL